MRVLTAALTYCAFVAAYAQPPKTDTLKDCRVEGIASEVSCGAIKRPINPDAPTEQLVLHYVVIPSLARLTTEPPLFLLAGGPGQSAISLSGPVANLFARLNQKRDLVLVDQRGTGKSLPLQCEPAPKQTSLATQMDAGFLQAQIRQCQEQLSLGKAAPGEPGQPATKDKAPIDLRFFSTTLAMQDLDAVRASLGYNTIDLIGASYGTRAALEYQRLFPARVRRVVLDGVAPPDMVLPTTGDRDAKAALQGVFDRCKSATACATVYPNLQSRYEQWLSSLPQPFSLTHPVTRKEEKVKVTESMVQTSLRSVLYAPSLSAALPFAISEAIAGRLGPLVGLAAQTSGGSKSGRLFEGMHFSVICTEDAPRMPAEALPANTMGQLYQQVCAKWPRGKIDPAFYQILEKKSGAVLLLSGGADPVTPPIHAQRVATALGPLARHIVVPNLAHGVMSAGCMPDLLYQFFNLKDTAAALQIDAKCVTDIPAPLFYLPTQSRQANRD